MIGNLLFLQQPDRFWPRCCRDLAIGSASREQIRFECGSGEERRRPGGRRGGLAIGRHGPLVERAVQIAAFEKFFALFAEERLQPGSLSAPITIGENPGSAGLVPPVPIPSISTTSPSTLPTC
ncbi:hypothetical protein [Jiella avicenniae]|uniref:Uncharacterized protein n=1 Tax=Jiella avicenniae TaxID=2907202 RepID=A0A9X1TAP1_9HYPH|nr:hypothetical protein [Jiella avicenniae]MCE7027343.1 hypothetical protein [Jiella avicenniae]